MVKKLLSTVWVTVRIPLLVLLLLAGGFAGGYYTASQPQGDVLLNTHWEYFTEYRIRYLGSG